ncbi:MAG: hypothetical protein JWO82_2510, partial [Akkermansiaceae bacterium]|nr:hypothetical protein [Akkermansiaceae bacterium]
PAGTALQTRPARGIFRFTSDLPSYDVRAGVWRNHTFKLTGTQEVLRG